MENKITINQYNFIQLLRKRYHYWDKMAKDKQLTKIQASYLIKKLLKIGGYDWRKF